MDVQAFRKPDVWTLPYDAQSVTAEAAETSDQCVSMLQVMAECGALIILLLNADQKILHVLGPTLQVLGRAATALHGETLDQTVCHYDGGGSGGSVLRPVLCCRRPDGDLVLLEARFRRFPFGQPGRTVCIMRDVTAEVRTRELVARLQTLEPIGQLTAGIAHDFNNLLQTMMGSLELLLDEIGDRPETRENAEAALRMGERGARLTHHLLAFMRQQVPRPRALSLGPLVEEIAHTLRRTLGPRIEVITRIAPELPMVYADAGQTEAALLNLALNARDAMPAGGKLTIEIAPSLGAGTSDSAGAGEQVVLTVADTGKGMRGDVLARACEPFFSTKESKGTGLGLPMVQTFAQQSGGELRLSSKPDAGTRVEIRLPVAHEHPSTGPGPTLAGPQAGRVLLVDDEPEVLVTFGSFLRGAGFTVRTARDGGEALAVLASGEVFDVMVTDYAMPGLAGEEVVSHVRLIAPDLPILVVSGYSDAERLMEMTRRLRVLRKPFRRIALVREVTALVDSRGEG